MNIFLEIVIKIVIIVIIIVIVNELYYISFKKLINIAQNLNLNNKT